LVQILFFAVSTYFGLALPAAHEEPTALPQGNLMLLLHEDAGDASESPTPKEIGAVTLRAATALTQKAGIVALSSTIWENLLFRINWFENQLQREGSLAFLLDKALQASGKGAAEKRKDLTETDPNLFGHFFAYKSKPTSAEWSCWHHEASGLILLIPADYLEKRLLTTPRTLPQTYAREEFALGIRLKDCKSIPLPPQTKGLEPLIRQAKHLKKRAPFSTEGLQKLFLPKSAVHRLTTVHWAVYMSGHGTPGKTEGNQDARRYVCGVPINTFMQLLSWCNKNLYVRCFYYQSCYANMEHIVSRYQASKVDKKSLKSATGFDFPLIAGALPDAPVHLDLPGLHADIDLPLFFNRAEKLPAQSWPSVLRPLTPITGSASDMHAIGATPLLLRAGSTTVETIDVQKTEFELSTNQDQSIRAGLRILTAKDAQSTDDAAKPFVVRGDRALLIVPLAVRRPLSIHRYQRVNRETRTSLFALPAIISLAPGSAQHYIERCVLHDAGLKDFLLDGFARLEGQKTTKTFLFDSLILANDIPVHFALKQASWWQHITSTISTWLDDRSITETESHIELRHVLITSSPHHLVCSFAVTHEGSKERAYQVLYTKSPALSAAAPELLPLHAIDFQKHMHLYKAHKKALESSVKA